MLAAQAFVPVFPPVGGEAAALAVDLRGARTATPPSSAAPVQQGSLEILAPALAAGALGALLRRGRPRGTARCAATATEAPSAEVEAEAAPPPPPPVFDPAEQLGAIAPLGFFDPLGFSKKGDRDGFRRLREAELKHGRVAMMASVGLLIQSFVPMPEILEDVPRGAAAAITPPALYGFVLLVVASGALELVFWTQDPEKEIGDFGDPANWGGFFRDPNLERRAFWIKGARERELSNGRFAMLATVGILLAELVTGKTAWAQFGLDKFTIER